MLLELNLLVGTSTATVPDESGPPIEPAFVGLAAALRSHEETLRAHHQALVDSHAALVKPVEAAMAGVREEASEAIAALVKTGTTQVESAAGNVLKVFAEELTKSSHALLEKAASQIATQQAEGAARELADLRAQIDLRSQTAQLCATTRDIGSRVATWIEKNAPTGSPTDFLEPMKRQEALLIKISETLASNQTTLPDAVAKLETVVREVATALRQLGEHADRRDTALSGAMVAALNSHAGSLREEIRRPRAFRFVESAHSDGNGGDAAAT